jgi:hypothetical protein
MLVAPVHELDIHARIDLPHLSLGENSSPLYDPNPGATTVSTLASLT